MKIIHNAETVDQATTIAYAKKAWDKMKAFPIKGNNNTCSYSDVKVGKYTFILVQSTDRGNTVRVNYYFKYGDNKPADSAYVGFDSNAW